ncbi:hypothetical protein LTR46_011807, partial [Exophiala xenobiotica]
KQVIQIYDNCWGSVQFAKDHDRWVQTSLSVDWDHGYWSQDAVLDTLKQKLRQDLKSINTDARPQRLGPKESWLNLSLHKRYVGHDSQAEVIVIEYVNNFGEKPMIVPKVNLHKSVRPPSPSIFEDNLCIVQ